MVRRRTKVISGLAVAGAAAGLATLVAFKVRANRAVVTFQDGHEAIATVAPSGEVRVTCACGQPNCQHMHAAAVVAAAEVPQNGNALWHTLRRSLNELSRRRSQENAETAAGVAQHVLETEGLTVTSAS
ncbi:MAG TPA: hypothetical protein VG370_31875 [Chloroflexota bacterium]|jgi:hypothetical protein|nr:hypothetical protein [Chloroflexota bacterium]